MLTRNLQNFVSESPDDENATVGSKRPSAKKKISRRQPHTNSGADENENTMIPETNCAIQQRIVKELKAKVKALEEESAEDKAQLQKLLETNLKCMICLDIIREPQVLQCGHTACYSCLRKCWTSPAHEQGDRAEIVSTDDEDQFEPFPLSLAPGRRPRLRHRFSSVVNRQKKCPLCIAVVRYRPVLDSRIQDILDTMDKHFHLLPREKRRRRQDMWHGIFHPEPNNLAPSSPPVPVVHLDLNLLANIDRAMESTNPLFEDFVSRAYEAGRQRAFMEFRAMILESRAMELMKATFNGARFHQGQGPQAQGFAVPRAAPEGPGAGAMPMVFLNVPAPPPPHQGSAPRSAGAAAMHNLSANIPAQTRQNTPAFPFFGAGPGRAGV